MVDKFLYCVVNLIYKIDFSIYISIHRNNRASNDNSPRPSLPKYFPGYALSYGVVIIWKPV